MSNKSVIFDIGCNHGDFAKKYCDEYRVICIEPNEKLANELKKQFAEKHIDVEQIAVSNHVGTILFDICSEDQLSSCNPKWLRETRYSSVPIEKTIEVECTTIDELVKKYGNPCHIKIDVEGHEFEVLCGMTKKICPVQFEFLGEKMEELTIPCLERLMDIGYEKICIRDQGGDFFVGEESSLNKIIPIEESISRIKDSSKQFTAGMILAL